MNAFTLDSRLPDSTVVLEASAGTGKTYTIAALACRYVAEQDRDIRDLLLITFGNAASDELRERVFAALASAELELRRYLDDNTRPRDEVARLLSGPDAQRHHARLLRAVEHFDEATIVTTHAFCQAMLRTLGILGDHDPAEVLTPDPTRLIEQCATDQYLHDFVAEDQPALAPKTALNIGLEACLGQAPLSPPDGPEAAFGRRVRERFQRRKWQLGMVTYDDLITRLHDALADPISGPAAIEMLRQRYAAVLVDEFQDTDPQQWAIIDKAFTGAGRPLVLVGDPKQSIYGFRNADVLSYLEATSRSRKLSLATNYRSDQALIDGVGELFGSVRLGDARITVDPVQAKASGTRLRIAPQARLWIRGGSADHLSVSPDDAIAEDLIGQVRRLLDEGTILRDAGDSTGRPVRPSDIVVLTRQGNRGAQLCRRLIEAGHAATVMGQQSVWRQPGACDWLTVLDAMAAPSTSANRQAALSGLIGAELTELISSSSPASAQAGALLREAAHAFDEGGIGRAFALLRLRTGLDARLLAEPGGERRLTDLVHVAELLGERGALGLEALRSWLAAAIAQPTLSDAVIRAEDDADAIRLMTMHAAKGLEFPIVLLPEVSRTKLLTFKPFPLIQDGRRVLHVGPRPPRNSKLEAEVIRQLRDEELRLLYVGLTRAKHLAIAWHVDDGPRSATSPMSALLYRAPDARELEDRYRPTPRRVSLNQELVLKERLDPTPRPPRAPEPGPNETHEPLAFPRRIDPTWRRTSYSGLTQALHDAAPVAGDEPEQLEGIPVDPALGATSPMAGLPAGAAFGTLVHAALEQLDWSAPALDADASRVASEVGGRAGLDAAQRASLALALRAVCRTPLSPLTGATLSELGTTARLAELDFDLPMAGLGRPGTVAELAELMGRHLDAADPLAAYPERLASTEAASGVLNGFLTGSIDAVLRTPEERFLVVDYKTNNLSPSPDVAPILGHYTRAAMAEAMMQAHYPLQALLYSAALHRFLGLRLPGYRPERHLGGVGYLFVRGMAGAETPVVDGATCGVFAWFPPPALAVATSELLGGMR